MSDYISREATLEAAKKSHLYFDLKPIINSVPSADVRPVVRGKWIETKTGFHCSVCKTKAKGTKDGALLSNFCPNCGARMEES